MVSLSLAIDLLVLVMFAGAGVALLASGAVKQHRLVLVGVGLTQLTFLVRHATDWMTVAQAALVAVVLASLGVAAYRDGRAKQAA